MRLKPGDKIQMLETQYAVHPIDYSITAVILPKGSIAVVLSVQEMIASYSGFDDIPEWFFPFHKRSIEEGKAYYVKILELPEIIDDLHPESNEKVPVVCDTGDNRWVFPGPYEVIERAH